jgi:hypothetical protein
LFRLPTGASDEMHNDEADRPACCCR